eukprot:TRINITY_DN4130_c0_g1_i1.p1 TRINITY_DN4130_c0_g1~~TRINITY_DN4130_c0_g1_i1.p1  ORF type:complete len:441 (+),score=103.26 TRINITY_DN4130_c0_g1_i1:110-1324(+)
MASKEKATIKWQSLKTTVARTKQKVLEKVGNVETTKDMAYDEEKKRILTLYDTLTKISKQITVYLDKMQELSICSNEIAEDMGSLYDTFDRIYPISQQYLNFAISIDRERQQLDEHIKKNVLEPLNQYLVQFKEVKDRMKELEVRRIDMDRYNREFQKDRKLSIENKYKVAKEGYDELLAELMRDLPTLFDDRVNFMEPVYAALIKSSNTFYTQSASASGLVLPVVSQINEALAATHPKIITPSDRSSVSKNYRATGIFVSPGTTVTPAQMSTTNSNTTTINTSKIEAKSSPQPSAPILEATYTNNTVQESNTNPFVEETPMITPGNEATFSEVPLTPNSEPRSLEPETKQMLMGLYDFNAEDPRELSFMKGDIMELVREEGEWFEVSISGRLGLIPSNYVKKI